MKFRSYVEPPEPMRGLEVPPEVVEALGGGKRPPVTITINGHSWKSRVAIMRGRYLLGLSNANRKTADVVTGDEVEVEVEIDAEPVLWPSPRTSPAPWTPIRSPAPPTTACPTAASVSTAGHRTREVARDTYTADREGPGHATGPGAGRGPRGPRQDPGRSPLTSSKGPRLPWRESTLRLGRVVAGGRTHHTSNHRG
jgi:hypothetical protein